MGTTLLKNCFHIFLSADEAPRRGEDILIRGNRIAAVGSGIEASADRAIDCSTGVVVPGFVNTHHHFFQTLTRNLPAVQNAELFDWLTYLYEIWKHLDEEAVYYASLLAMGELLKTGCTTTTDHHYVYPRHAGGDMMGVQFKAAEVLGMRFSPTRGSMSLGKKDGARLLKFDRVGKIRPGWAADLAVFDVGKLEYSGSLSDPLAAIIFAGFDHGAEYTIVNGNLAVDGGVLTGFDETELMHRCNRIAKRLLEA